MINITLQQIRNISPCENMWLKILAANGGTKADFSKTFPVASILESNGLDDTLWVLRCLPEHNNLWRKFAWWCAKRVEHIADNDVVSDCLEVILKHSNGEATDGELEAAEDAAWDEADAAAGPTAWAILAVRDAAQTVTEATEIGKEASGVAAQEAAETAAQAFAQQAAVKAAQATIQAVAWDAEYAAQTAPTAAWDAARAAAYEAQARAWSVALEAARATQIEKLKEILSAGQWVD